MEITNLIIKEREKLIQEESHRGCDSPYQINNGWCVEFADRIYRILGEEVTILSIENFTNNYLTGSNSEWAKNEDGKYLCDFWGSIVNKNISPETFEYHDWIFYNGKHYDAECPEGVDNFMDLPIFKKRLN